jgi:tetratricopeptide (TPR) repeat protein
MTRPALLSMRGGRGWRFRFLGSIAAAGLRVLAADVTGLPPGNLAAVAPVSAGMRMPADVPTDPTALSGDPPAPAPLGAPGPARPLPLEAHPSPAVTAEAREFVTRGHSLTERGDLLGAEFDFMQVLNSKAGRLEKRDALIGLGHMFRKRGELTKAAAVFDKFLKEFGGDEQSPVVYLDLGRTLRDMGSYHLAIMRFYDVINSTLKLPGEGFDTYRQLAKTAQFEIAETYFLAGEFEEAGRFYNRLKLLDLAPADRARAHFKSVYSVYLTGDYPATVEGLRGFLDQNPTDENVPEARYLLSLCLGRLHRYSEAYEVTIDLLKAERPQSAQNRRRWAYWQRKTGNQLANEFYGMGDFTSALVIYRGLAALAEDPEWQLPLLYQIGLCQERLRQPESARGMYQTILDNAHPAKGETPSAPYLQDLFHMAAWRCEHLAWQQTTEAKFDSFFQPLPRSPGDPVNPPRHDPDGSVAKAPAAVQ